MGANGEPIREERDILRLVVVLILFVILAGAFVSQLFAYLNSREALHRAKETNKELRQTNERLRRVVVANRRLALQGKEAHDNLCKFKRNLAQQIDASQVFVDKHPEGLDGISAQEIQVSIDRQKAALVSLRTLHCRAATKP